LLRALCAGRLRRDAPGRRQQLLGPEPALRADPGRALLSALRRREHGRAAAPAAPDGHGAGLRTEGFSGASLRSLVSRSSRGQAFPASVVGLEVAIRLYFKGPWQVARNQREEAEKILRARQRSRELFQARELGPRKHVRAHSGMDGASDVRSLFAIP